MVVPLVARWAAAACGIVLVLTGWQSVVGTLIVPRPVASWLTRAVDRLVVAVYRAVTRPVTDYVRRDRILATQAAAILVTQLGAWLGIFLVGFTLTLWPSPGRNLTTSLADAGSSLFTLGFAEPPGTTPAVIVFIAAATGMTVIALQIGYLPTLYAAFNRRETEVTMLVARAGAPAWGPEILARTKWGIYDGDTRPILDELFTSWESWAADVAESHTTYLTLVRFRSPRPLSHWLTSLIAVMDAAALHLSLAPSREPKLAARLSLRMGFVALERIARAMRLRVPDEPSPDVPISVTFEEFRDAVAMLRGVGYPIERTDDVAWPHFRGWRANYDVAALALARELDAPPALWTGDRRWPSEPIPPRRPRLQVASGAVETPPSPTAP
jgi:hypothetical protein